MFFAKKEILNSLVLDAFPYLSAVTLEEWTKAQPTIRRFPAKSYIFKQEEAKSYGMFLLKGTARISRIAADGGQFVMGTITAGEVCGLLVLSGLSERDYPGAITAESEVEVLFVAKQSFLSWIQTHDEIRNAVFGGLLDGINRSSERFEKQWEESLDTRLSRALLRMTSDQNLLNVTHQELAVEIGSAREVVSRVLARYRTRGWIETGRGWIRIIHRDELQSQLSD